MARKRLTGVVVSDRMMKTRVVRVTRLVRHPVYQRVVRRMKNFKVHDEKNESRLGDEVRIEESRPITREKRWRLIQTLRKNPEIKEEVVG